MSERKPLMPDIFDEALVLEDGTLVDMIKSENVDPDEDEDESEDPDGSEE